MHLVRTSLYVDELQPTRSKRGYIGKSCRFANRESMVGSSFLINRWRWHDQSPTHSLPSEHTIRRRDFLHRYQENLPRMMRNALGAYNRVACWVTIHLGEEALLYVMVEVLYAIKTNKLSRPVKTTTIMHLEVTRVFTAFSRYSRSRKPQGKG